MPLVIRKKNGKDLYTSESDTFQEAVETAVAEGLSLDCAALSGEALAGAELAGAKLGGADLSGADLTGVEDAQFAAYLQQVLDALRSTSFPTIAAIEGAALGAGTATGRR